MWGEVHLPKSGECNQTKMKLRVELDWRTTLATVLLLPTLLSLGFWQLERGDEKAELIARLEERRLEPPMSLAATMRLPTQDLADRQVVFTATFDEDNYVLLDNRLRDGRFGYEVVAFVSVGDASAGALIAPLNLGWIEGDRSRMTTPSPQLPVGEHRVHGRIYQSAGEAFLLGDNAFPVQRPAVVQQLTLARWEESMRETLGRPVFPHEVRALPTEPTAFSAEWAVVNQTPAKHRGYAVQWFTMAAALGLAFIFRSSNLATWLRHRLVSSGD